MVTNPGRPMGGVDGNWAQLVPQAVSVVAALAIGAIGTFIILKILDATMGLRVSQDDEIQGLDVTQHGEEGYIFY
jgi:Amt family ammonium transporter